MRYLYTVLFYLMLPFLFIRLAWRARQNAAYLKNWGERLGFCPMQLKKCIWIHAVSVGEVVVAIPLIKALQVSYPGIPLLVTNMTPTGAARVKAAFGETVLQAYIPYDVPDAVGRFLDRINPVIAIIIETELWPNVLAACRGRNIPVVVTNARLSEKSAKGYAHVPELVDQMLASIHTLAVQSNADADR
ncbi:MAG TPA: glycosyltransferase N-terminal domain-containing protein, partial [Gammaproteobacteria bacterium]|nr:glycosyltransferase N-terminal domain-containing protein [Gammaproteobacteria bacterium]